MQKRSIKKRTSGALAVLLSFAVLLGVSVPVFAADSSYTIESPYSEVTWGETPEFKGNLHTHSTWSDANETLVDTLSYHYNQGFDFVAMTDHGVTGVDWDKAPYKRILYSYQRIAGYDQNHLTTEEFTAMKNGSYPLESTNAARGAGMTCVTGGNELNALTASKSHVNGFFLPENFGNTNFGYENGFEYAVRIVDEQGGLSHINHPGDWLGSTLESVYDEENLELFQRIFMKYDSCLGMEVFNEKNSVTPYDRILWDNLLMKTLPYGRNIIGFSNNDTHARKTVDSSFSVFMMESNTVKNIKDTMQSGSFFMITRKVRNNDVIGPEKEIDVMDKLLAYPMFNQLTVDNHRVTVKARDAKYVQWIANGKVIFKQDITSANEAVTLDLDSIKGSEDFLYIRAELYGDGGLCASQALVINDGTQPLEYKEDVSFKALLSRFLFALKSLRCFVYIQEISKELFD